MMKIKDKKIEFLGDRSLCQKHSWSSLDYMISLTHFLSRDQRVELGIYTSVFVFYGFAVFGIYMKIFLDGSNMAVIMGVGRHDELSWAPYSSPP